MNGDSSKHNDNPSTYEIGDLYYEGSKAVGIVVDTKDNGKHATIMSLTSFDKNGEFCKVEDEISWDVATHSVKKLGKGWHLPSREEFKTMYNSFKKIQSVLKETKGALVLNDNDVYWSSTEKDSE